MTHWSTDISTAPRGKTVTSTRKVGNNTHEITDFVPDVIWLATKCGKVSRSYWIPDAGKTPGRWSGLATREEPVAWMSYIVPEHPFNQSGADAVAAVTGKAQLANAESVEPSASGLIQTKHIFLDDAGSGV